jgi:hypothetical protein
MNITPEQLEQLLDLAADLDRLALVSEQMAMPPAYHLKQMDRALPEIALRLKALCMVIRGWSDEERTRNAQEDA